MAVITDQNFSISAGGVGPTDSSSPPGWRFSESSSIPLCARSAAGPSMGGVGSINIFNRNVVVRNVI